MGFDLMTLNTVVGLTFLIQAVVIGFHASGKAQFQGIRTFLASAVVLAAGSLMLVLMAWWPPGIIGLASNVLMLLGAGLQLLALCRFLGHRVDRWLFGGGMGVGLACLVLLGWDGPPSPWFFIRDLVPIPFEAAAAVVILRSNTQGFRTGALLTALPFAGYALRSVFRIVFGWADPSSHIPGPPFLFDGDALAYFVFSFLWTSGFLLMINQRLQSALETQATQDSLTGCWNRRAADQRLVDEEARLARGNTPYTLVLIDLDHFKRINDQRGHDVGDHVLKRTAQVLQSGLRTSDRLARWGGEEFLLILPGTKEEEAMSLLERLRLTVEATDYDHPNLTVTFSAGVAEARRGEGYMATCRAADVALYEAKKTRNRVVSRGPE